MNGDHHLVAEPQVTLDGTTFPKFDADNARGWQKQGDWDCGQTMSRFGTGVVIGCNLRNAAPGTHVFHASYHAAQADLSVAIGPS